MVFPSDTPHNHLQVSNGHIKLVNNFTYLGIDVSDSRTAFRNRRVKAWAAAAKLSIISRSEIRDDLKVQLFKAITESVLLYRAEALTINATLAKEIDRPHSALLRNALNIHWPQRVTNISLYQLARIPRGGKTARKKRLGLYGHVMRHPTEIPAGLILHTQPKEKYRVGGHRRTTYEAVIAADFQLLLASPTAWQDRNAWNMIVTNAALT